MHVFLTFYNNLSCNNFLTPIRENISLKRQNVIFQLLEACDFFFYFRLDTFTKKMSNLLLPFTTRGAKGYESLQIIIKQQKNKYNQGDFCFLCIILIYLLGKDLQWFFQTVFFFHLREKKSKKSNCWSCLTGVCLIQE